MSALLSAETQDVLKRKVKESHDRLKTCSGELKSTDAAALVKAAAAYRDCMEKNYYRDVIARHRARYKVTIEPQKIAGVATEIIAPAEGVSAGNRQRVLINLHGGGFVIGNRWGGQIESIPIAAVGKLKVVSVDYRMAPEYQFPAASEDAAAVYKALLKDYKPENIGIYGCSAGGMLTAQAVAWFLKEGLPMPGAIGMFCAAAAPARDSDSARLGGAMAQPRSGNDLFSKAVYIKQSDKNDPLAFPGLDPKLMARFPPSLLISSTRDGLLSAVVSTHSQLVKLGVEADLHVWEGLGHAFFFEPDLPESREVYDVTARFFNEHLGRRR